MAPELHRFLVNLCGCSFAGEEEASHPVRPVVPEREATPDGGEAVPPVRKPALQWRDFKALPAELRDMILEKLPNQDLDSLAETERDTRAYLQGWEGYGHYVAARQRWNEAVEAAGDAGAEGVLAGLVALAETDFKRALPLYARLDELPLNVQVMALSALGTADLAAQDRELAEALARTAMLRDPERGLERDYLDAIRALDSEAVQSGAVAALARFSHLQADSLSDLIKTATRFAGEAARDRVRQVLVAAVAARPAQQANLLRRHRLRDLRRSWGEDG